MNGIIADLIFGFVLSEDEEHKGYYQALTLGYFDEIASRLDGSKDGFAMMTKIGHDNEGLAAKEYYTKGYDYNLRFCESLSFPTALSVEGDNRLRYSSLSDIKKEEVLSFMDDYDVDRLFVSGTLLSMKGVAEEIVSAVLERKDSLNLVAVDTSLDWDILLLEEVKECTERIRDSGIKTILIGEALTIEGVGGMSVTKRDSILSGLSEQERQERI